MALSYDGQLKRFDVTIAASNSIEGQVDRPRVDRGAQPLDAGEEERGRTLSGKYADWESLHKKLIGWCSKFSFQLEKGESGYLHWQCRVQLIHKKACPSLLRDVVPAIGGHWSITSNGIHDSAKSFNYVLKEDTRVDGPWDDSSHIEEKPPLTRQLIKFMEYDFYPYQGKLLNICQIEEDRWIYRIVCPNGNTGKSIMVEFLEYQGIAFEMPPLRGLEDLMAFAHSFPPKKVYLIDMPRGMNKEKLAEFYSGVETLKNGITYDKRYTGKKRRMDRPQIIVFCNYAGKDVYLSQDRWRNLVIDEKTMDFKEVKENKCMISNL